MKMQFFGAARQVTGSQYYLESDGVKLLVDCGMFQERDFLGRNWEARAIRPRDLDAILLTHAHVDHCGLVPVLVREGFRGPIITTAASADLVELVLRDAAEIQAEDAAFKEKRHRKEGRRGKYPVKPLFTFKDVDRTLPLLHTAAYHQEYKINDHVSAVFHDAGHILGSAMIELLVGGPDPEHAVKGDSPIFADHRDHASHGAPTVPAKIGTVPSLTRKSGQSPGHQRRLIFTGDLGQTNKPIVRDPETFAQADYVVMESTYGNRDHENGGSVESQLENVIRETIGAGGCIVIPIFAIERAQEMIYHLNRLLAAGRIPQIPVFLDSPMAADVNEVFRDHRDCFDAEALDMLAAGQSILKFPALKVVRTQEDSMAINDIKCPFIVMSTSGMCTAGRIKHHLAHHIERPECTILFVGYQARGTLGRQILDGNPEVRIHGRSRLVRARVAQIQGISGHADRSGLMKWLSSFQSPPRQLFVTHGEEDVAISFAKLVRETLGWHVTVPEYKQVVELE